MMRKRPQTILILGVIFLSNAALAVASSAENVGESSGGQSDLWAVADENNATSAPTSSPTTISSPTLSPTVPSNGTNATTSAPTVANVSTSAPTAAPSSSPSKSPAAGTPAPTPKATTAAPTAPPTPAPTVPPSDDDEPKKRMSVLRFIEKTIAICILLVLSLLAFGAIMKNRYRIFFCLRGVWYTILGMECTAWIMQKLGISNYQPVDAGLSTVIFENEMDEGLLMRETDT